MLYLAVGPHMGGSVSNGHTRKPSFGHRASNEDMTGRTTPPTLVIVSFSEQSKSIARMAEGAKKDAAECENAARA
jgi:hypothetical protein